MNYPLSETVLQFGGGKFLRGFADLFLHHANESGQNVGHVVVLQSTDSERARLLNAQGGHYHVLIRGLWQGQLVDRVEESRSVSRALVAQTEWNAVLDVGRSPALRYILSNTTEAGLTLDPADGLEDAPPRSFPAKLLRVLKARFDDGLPGVTILPTELIAANAVRLRELVLEQARLWNLPETLADWLQAECDWRNALVDRIVTGPPPAHPLRETDRLLITAEPFAFWAVERNPRSQPLFTDPAILETDDVTPYFLRKVRILNAAHTSLVHQAIPRGIRTVREAIADPVIAANLHALLFEEILPTITERVDDAEGFARQTLERFANPFQEHQITDIAIYHTAKVAVRLIPTRDEYVAKFGTTPKLLEEAIAASQDYAR